MVTGRNFSMSGINLRHHYLPTYQILMISDNVEFLRYCGNHFENGDRWKFFNVGTSLSTHISNFDDIGQCWIFAVLWRPFWKWRPVKIFQCRESIRDINIYPHIKFWWYRTMLNFCGIVVAILKMATGRNFSMAGINSGHHYLPTYQILMISDNVEFLPPIFYAVFWQPFWKFWTRRIAPLMVTYHYVKFYVSIIIHLEVININVRNFNFPIGFYSNPHPLWTPQNMTLTPFTTKLKTLGPTRNIYL